MTQQDKEAQKRQYVAMLKKKFEKHSAAGQDKGDEKYVSDKKQKGSKKS